MTSSPKFPSVAIALLVSGALLITFLLPLIAHATTAIRVVGHTIALGALLSGGFLAMRYYWVYDKPLFKRKVVLFAFGIVLLVCSYAFITHQANTPIASVHH